MSEQDERGRVGEGDPPERGPALAESEAGSTQERLPLRQSITWVIPKGMVIAGPCGLWWERLPERCPDGWHDYGRLSICTILRGEEEG